MKSWIDESGTLDWLDTVWGKRKGDVFKKQLMLVWESFSAHQTEKVKQQCHVMKSYMALISGSKCFLPFLFSYFCV